MADKQATKNSTKEQLAVVAIRALYEAAKRETADTGASRVDRAGTNLFKMLAGRKPTPEELKAMFW